ncbi:kelch repeat protein [Oesophagostomum dentatum]|uniref:Kelch repeat protein n=1 Tax=Oesophagostomum dentatum TaxID=61180 RepID=A0A0B1TED2_OESDE|nr:kelch repeat protein [Oesophagostomum dentatum]
MARSAPQGCGKKALSKDRLYALLDDDRLNVHSDDEVLEIIRAWRDVCDGREKYYAQLLGVVRLAGLSKEKANKLAAENLINNLSKKPVRPPRDQVKREWKPLCDLSLIHPIAYHGAVVLNDELYVIGGTDGENHYSTVMKMNKFGEWTEVAPMDMNQMRSDAAAASAGGKLYVSGGFNGNEVRTASIFVGATR